MREENKVEELPSTLYTHAPTPKRTIQRWGTLPRDSLFPPPYTHTNPLKTDDLEMGGTLPHVPFFPPPYTHTHPLKTDDPEMGGHFPTFHFFFHLIHTRTLPQTHDPEMGKHFSAFHFFLHLTHTRTRPNARSRERKDIFKRSIFPPTLYTHAPPQTRDPDRGHRSTIFQSGVRTCRFSLDCWSTFFFCQTFTRERRQVNSGFSARLYHFLRSDIHHREPSAGIIFV